jgi:hypothetical protein
LYTDALDKTDLQRQLYGDNLKELNRRLLVLNNWTGDQSNPGKITWGEPLIVNVKEEIEADTLAKDLGVVSQKTLINRYQSRYGVSYEDVIKQLAEEKGKQPPPAPVIGQNTDLPFSGIKGIDLVPNSQGMSTMDTSTIKQMNQKATMNVP